MSRRTDRRPTPPRFDPRDPMGRRTLHDIAVTGAGQASPKRLWGAVAGSALLAAALLFTHHRLIIPLPAAVAAFAGYGLALQEIHRLDVRQEAARGRRRLLTGVASVAVMVASLAILAGLALLVARGVGIDFRALGFDH